MTETITKLFCGILQWAYEKSSGTKVTDEDSGRKKFCNKVQIKPPKERKWKQILKAKTKM